MRSIWLPFLVTWLPVLTVATPNTADKSYRLPTTVLPSHYTLDLTIDPGLSTYNGFVEITLETQNKTNTIQLHASPEYLTIANSRALLDYETSCNITATDNDTELVTLTCPKDSLNGKHTLTMEFKGVLSTGDMDGVYKSSYVESGKTKYLVSTQFEPIFARRAFPCFDEPEFKATFDVFVTYPEGYNVVSNTPQIQTMEVGNGMIQVQFQTTPKMSTYLLAFVVSIFKAKGTPNKVDYAFKVYAKWDSNLFMYTAINHSTQLIEALGAVTGIAYELLGNKQIYQIAIPDFSAGAMENWGLITYREADFIDEGNKTSAASKQRIITTIAHELSHQWFGDYVTLDWWSDTWLNEGFATYFEYHIPDLVEDLNMETSKQFVIDVVQSVLQSDALPSSLPLSSPESDINTLAEENNKFDSISYDKGASVVRMLKGILGDDNFQKGLQLYLKQNQYQNTNPSILLSSFEATNTSLDYNISKIAENWIYQPGYPLVTATLNDSTVILSQERFTTIQDVNDDTQWYIPISYTTSDERDFNVKIKTLFEPNSTAQIEINEGSWIILNIQEIGFFRVNYDDTLWDRIIAALKNNNQRSDIDVLNRAQLIDDIFNIAKVGKVEYDTVFELAGYLGTETEYYPWASALNALSYLTGKLGDDEAESLLRTITLNWINAAFLNLTTVDSSSHIEHIKVDLILDWACKLGQEECIDYALQTFADYQSTGSLSDYNKRDIVFCYALQRSSNPSEDFEFLFNIFKNSTSPPEQSAILSALGCISDTSVLQNYLSETIAADSAVRKQDAASVFKAVYSSSDVGLGVAMTFLEDNLSKIAETYKGMSALSSIIVGLAKKVKTDEQIDRLKKIIDDNADIGDIQVVGQSAVEIFTANREWTATYGPKIKIVLQNMNTAGASVLNPNVILTLILSFVALYPFHFNK